MTGLIESAKLDAGDACRRAIYESVYLALEFRIARPEETTRVNA